MDQLTPRRNPQRTPRRWVIGMALLGFVVLVALVLFAAYSRFLPHPQYASRNQLLFWVATRDLSQESPELRRALLQRLILEFDQEVSLESAPTASLPTAYQERIQDNIETLKVDWFALQVEKYRYESELRWSQAQASFEQARRWLDAARQWQAETEDRFDVASEIQALIQSLPEAERERGETLVGDAVVIWLTQTDLAEWSEQDRRTLASAIARALDVKPLQGAGIEQEFTAEQQQRLQQNAHRLLGSWAGEQAEELSRLTSASQRRVFMDEQIDRIERWGVLQTLAVASSSPSSPSREDLGEKGLEGWQSSLAAVNLLNEITADWVRWSKEPSRPQMEALVKLLQERIAARALRALISF